MKKILLTLVLLVGVVLGLFAQKLTYQAVIRDNNQQLVVNTPMKATVTIAFETGNPYTETVNATTNIHGLLSFEFGGTALLGRDWTNATIAVKVVNKNDESTVYVNGDARPVSAVPYALSVDGQSIQNYLTEHNYVDLDKLNDTLSAYSTTAALNDLLQQLEARLADKIDSLAHIVDSLSQLIPGGDTPATFSCGTSKVKDVDNNEYNTVLIGSQCWMAQNLRTNVGGGVYPKKGDTELTADEQVTYGRLYTWDAMMSGSPSTNYPAGNTAADTIVHGICPEGWHVPSDSEWTQLTTYVKLLPEYVCDGCSGTDDEWYTYCIAKALASKTGWNTDNNACNVGNAPENNDATGFAAVPAGSCFYGGFDGFGYYAYFWSATQDDGYTAWYRYLYFYDSYVYSYYDHKDYGFSVRCLRD